MPVINHAPDTSSIEEIAIPVLTQLKKIHKDGEQ
jgi:hypothetical protein